MLYSGISRCWSSRLIYYPCDLSWVSFVSRFLDFLWLYYFSIVILIFLGYWKLHFHLFTVRFRVNKVLLLLALNQMIKVIFVHYRPSAYFAVGSSSLTITDMLQEIGLRNRQFTILARSLFLSFITITLMVFNLTFVVGSITKFTFLFQLMVLFLMLLKFVLVIWYIANWAFYDVPHAVSNMKREFGFLDLLLAVFTIFHLCFLITKPVKK